MEIFKLKIEEDNKKKVEIFNKNLKGKSNSKDSESSIDFTFLKSFTRKAK